MHVATGQLLSFRSRIRSRLDFFPRNAADSTETSELVSAQSVASCRTIKEIDGGYLGHSVVDARYRGLERPYPPQV